MKTTILWSALALALAGAACSDDAPVADPGGMGAGRPDGPARAEEPAQEVLDVAGQPAMQDTTEAGGGSVTGALRDSVTGMSGGGQQRPGVDSAVQAGEPRRRQ